MSGYFGGGGGGGGAGLWQDDGSGTTIEPIAPYVNISVPGTATFGSTVTAVGQFLAPDGTVTAPGYAYSSTPSVGLNFRVNGIGVTGQSVEKMRFGGITTGTNEFFGLREDAYIGFNSGGAANLDHSGNDVKIWRDEAAVLALRDGVTSQAFRVYGTYTDASNYERLAIHHDNTYPRIKAESAGTGTARDLGLACGTGRDIFFQAADTTLAAVDGGALALLSYAAGNMTLGTAAKPWKTLFVGATHTTDVQSIDAAPTWNNAGVTFTAIKLNVTNTASDSDSLLIDLQIGGTSQFKVGRNGRLTIAEDAYMIRCVLGGTGPQTVLASSAAGILKVTNGAGSDFGRIQFGGETSSYPALKRSTTTLEARLADDSAYTSITASRFVVSGVGSSGDPTLTHASDPSTGIYFNTGGWKINFTVSNTQVIGIGSNRMDLRDDILIRWSNVIGSGVNAAIFNPSSTALLRVNKGDVSGTGTAALQFSSWVEEQTGNDTLTDAESNTVYTNEGAGGDITLTLPTAVAGIQYTFIVQENNKLEVEAASGDTIRIATEESAAAGTIDSDLVGSTVTLVCINATEWVAVAMLGTWTVT